MFKVRLSVSLLIALSLYLTANASLEEGINDQNLIRGPLALNQVFNTYSQDGIGLIDSNGNANSEILLNSNDAGDLQWNGNQIIDSSGDVNTANLTRSASEPGLLSSRPIGRVLFQSADNVTSLVDAPSLQTNPPQTSSQPITPLLVLTADDGPRWLYVRTSTVITGNGQSTCELACRNQSQVDQINTSLIAKNYSTFCTSAREQLRPISCQTPAGSQFGTQNICTCISFSAN